MVWRAYWQPAADCLLTVFEKLTAKAAFLGSAKVNPCSGGVLTLEWFCRLRISASTVPFGSG